MRAARVSPLASRMIPASRHISDYFGAYADDDLPDGLYNVPPTETISTS